MKILTRFFLFCIFVSRRPCFDNTKIKGLKLIGILLFCHLLIACATPHIDYYQDALKLEQTGQYYNVAQLSIKSLDSDPTYKNSYDLLKKIAESGFKQREVNAQKYIEQNNYPAAITVLNELKIFARESNAHGVNIPIANSLDEKIKDVTNEGSQNWYNIAEDYFKKQDYENAISAYKKALGLNNGLPPFNRSSFMLYFLTEFNKEEDHAQEALPSRRHFIKTPRSRYSYQPRQNCC